MNVETEAEYWARLSRGRAEKVEVKPPQHDNSCVVKNSKHQQFFEFSVAKKKRIVNWVKFFKVNHYEPNRIMSEMKIGQKMYDDIITFGSLDSYRYD